MEALSAQPFYTWMRDNNIKIDISSFSDMITFQHVFYITAEMTAQQKTFFLLKYGEAQ